MRLIATQTMDQSLINYLLRVLSRVYNKTGCWNILISYSYEFFIIPFVYTCIKVKKNYTI